MCITAPGRVIEIDAAGAVVDLTGVRRRASTLVMPDVAVGDWVLVGAGTILRRVEEAEARELSREITAAIAGADEPLSTEGDPR
jgi:hydrogenase assembly chaperone HypC/HupF